MQEPIQLWLESQDTARRAQQHDEYSYGQRHHEVKLEDNFTHGILLGTQTPRFARMFPQFSCRRTERLGLVGQIGVVTGTNLKAISCEISSLGAFANRGSVVAHGCDDASVELAGCIMSPRR